MSKLEQTALKSVLDGVNKASTTLRGVAEQIFSKLLKLAKDKKFLSRIQENLNTRLKTIYKHNAANTLKPAKVAEVISDKLGKEYTKKQAPTKVPTASRKGPSI